MSIGLVILIVVMGIWAVVVWRTAARPHVNRTEAFADLYDISLTDRSRSMLDESIRRSRRFRLAGAVVITSLYVGIARDTGMWSLLGAIAVGLAIGSLFDEGTRPGSTGAGATRASLDRRSVTTYVERWVLASLFLAMAAALATCAVLLRLDAVGVPVSDTAGLPSRNATIAWMAGLAAVGCFGAVLLRRLVLLPTSAEAPDLCAVRHALRMASVLSVVGAMLVICGFVGARLGNVAMLRDGSRRDLVQWTSNISTLVSVLAIAVGLPLSLRAIPRTVSRGHARPTSRTAR